MSLLIFGRRRRGVITWIGLMADVLKIQDTREHKNSWRVRNVDEASVGSACLISQFGLISWVKTSDGAYFFLVRATKKIKTVLDQKIPQKNYRRCKSCLSVLEHLKKQLFSKNILKKSKNICEIQKISNIYSFHSIVLPLCVSKQFSLSM